MTRHRFRCADARSLDFLADSSVHLVVTSPPYPMIAMWDALFTGLDPEIGALLDAGCGREAHERMNCLLDPVWGELFRVLTPGGFACINIGDAARTVAGTFQLYSNHTRILRRGLELGFESLPLILWRKQTNAPTKFMGSGMLPAGAYVTLEHEYILILRKPGKRVFAEDTDRMRRRRSALFWEERNSWYSDLWEIKGSRQPMTRPEEGLGPLFGAATPAVAPQTRDRAGSFPFELAFRLVSMFSVAGDLVLDPFLGTGTTALAALAAARDSVGVDVDAVLLARARERMSREGPILNGYLEGRLDRHRDFVTLRAVTPVTDGPSATSPGATSPGLKPLSFKYRNRRYGFPVMTAQETDLEISLIDRIEADGDGDVVVYYRQTSA